MTRARSLTLFCLPALLLTALPGCFEPEADDAPPVQFARESAATGPESYASPTSLPAVGGWRKYNGVSFKIPDEWKETEAKMIDSKYIMSTEDGDLEITLTSMGGGVDFNASRWLEQMQQAPGDSPEEEIVSLDGVEARLIDIRGKFNSRVGTQRVAANSRLIGVALPIRPREFYVKLIGPRDAVANYYDDFRAFLKTAQVEQ